jgi:hypothetical protein
MEPRRCRKKNYLKLKKKLGPKMWAELSNKHRDFTDLDFTDRLQLGKVSILLPSGVNIAMENGPFIDDLPIIKRWFSIAMLVITRG